MFERDRAGECLRETTGRVGGEWAVVNRESRGAGSRALFRSCVLTASWLLPCCSSSRLTCNQSRSSEGLGGASMSEAGTVNLIAGARGNKHGSCGGRLLRGKAHGQMRAACQHGRRGAQCSNLYAALPRVWLWGHGSAVRYRRAR